MFEASGQPRPQYARLAEALSALTSDDVERKQAAAELSFRARGITFSLNQGEDGVEKIMPFDLVPRVITASEWQRIERGLEQRVRALNLFLADIYHEQRILNQGVIPWEIVLGSAAYQREMRGMVPPLGVYTHVVGSDLVRGADGELRVLEDNLRTPSGVSYVVENRRVLKRTWPQVFNGYDVRPVEGYPQDLLDTLRAAAPPSADDPVVVVLTPGTFNSAYFEHAFLAKSMGAELVMGSDLFVDDGAVWMRTTQGPRRVDVIYRRVDDAFLDPLAFRSDTILGVAGLVASYRLGRVTLANALGTGVADDKAVYAYVPQIIRYYLGEDQILPNVDTYVAAEPKDFDYILDHIEQLVVKAVNESGGYGMLIGPHATRAEHEDFRARVRANPRNYIAQPTLQLSRHPCWVEDHLEGRHVDLRPFVLFGDEVRVTPGGLTRVALKRGSLVVNSSQGGGAKDTWVLMDGVRA
ncbi:MAG: circularly permuted type 2 ATP-grasp protein [Chloroflexota bacterium]